MLNLEMDLEFKGLNDFSRILDEWEVRLSPRFMSYRPRHHVRIETTRYTLKTASRLDELLRLFHLRHAVFKGDASKLDLDHLDHACDHLLILDNSDGSIVGTYRLIFGSEYYSDGEFNLSQFKKLPGTKLELGRACIQEEHRNGSVIDLLWKGIGRYQELTGAQYLFGCSSIFTVNPKEMSALMSQMRAKGRFDDGLKIRPVPSFTHPKLTGSYDEPISATLPSLLASYLMAGAKVHGTPAYDEEFFCFDWLTILNVDEISSSYKRRYFPHLQQEQLACES